MSKVEDFNQDVFNSEVLTKLTYLQENISFEETQGLENAYQDICDSIAEGGIEVGFELFGTDVVGVEERAGGEEQTRNLILRNHVSYFLQPALEILNQKEIRSLNLIYIHCSKPERSANCTKLLLLPNTTQIFLARKVDLY